MGGKYGDLLLAVAVIAANPTTASVVFNKCERSILQEDYEHAARIVVAEAAACAGGIQPADGGCPPELWRFDVLETLKSRSPSTQAEPLFLKGAYVPGSVYLFFLDRHGVPFECGGRRPLSGDDLPALWAREHLEILRQYRDGLISDLSA